MESKGIPGDFKHHLDFTEIFKRENFGEHSPIAEVPPTLYDMVLIELLAKFEVQTALLMRLARAFAELTGKNIVDQKDAPN